MNAQELAQLPKAEPITPAELARFEALIDELALEHKLKK